MERENKLLTNLVPLVNLAIPVPQFMGRPSKAYPAPFQGYQLIKGTSAYLSDLNREDCQISLPTLAKFLKLLHSISESQALQLGAQQQVFDRTEIDGIVARLCGRVSKIIEKNMKLELEIGIGNKQCKYCEEIKMAREYMIGELIKNEFEIVRSKSNFILVRVKDVESLLNALKKEKILIRDRSTLINLDNCVRITVGTMQNMKNVLDILKRLNNE